jgi:hypothetical protein
MVALALRVVAKDGGGDNTILVVSVNEQRVGMGGMNGQIGMITIHQFVSSVCGVEEGWGRKETI